MLPKRLTITCTLTVVVIALTTGLLRAQESSDTRLTKELLESRLQAAEASSELNDQSRAFVVEKYKQALSDLQTLKTLQSDIEQTQSDIQEAPDLLTQAQRQLESPADVSIGDLAETVEEAEKSGQNGKRRWTPLGMNSPRWRNRFCTDRNN